LLSSLHNSLEANTSINYSGNCGGLISGFIFLPKDSPKFLKGFSILLAFLSMSFIGSVVMTLYFRRENARRDKEFKPPGEYTQAEMELEREKGERASFFRFIV